MEAEMKVRTYAAVALVLAVLTTTTRAHHSFTAFWHTDREVEITGIVKSVKLVNPHSEMIVEVTDASGAKADWIITSRATGSGILKGGWTSETVPVGTRVKVAGHPSRKEGVKALAAGTITLPDGKVVCFGGNCGILQG
jgi:hypothetical protein